MIKKLSDQMWRLSNLYYIIDKNGEEILFKPNATQILFLQKKHSLNLILKARQAGISTLIQILMLDSTLFIPNTHTATIVLGLGTAKAFMDRARLAYSRLPDEVKNMTPIFADSVRGIAFANGSSLSVDVSIRACNYQMLHISEYAEICKRHPQRAEEIRMGLLSMTPINRSVFIESTGDMSGLEEFKDFKFHFFPWHIDPTYVLNADVPITKSSAKYFDELNDGRGIELTQPQKNWYAMKSKILGCAIKKEYPSYPEELVG